jgi:4-amino-4-deoxy-L-arabinose transferase-like glycosyltransferase
MESPWLGAFLQNKRITWLVSALIVICFLATNLPWQLDDYDQAKQAFTSFEMSKEGHWFYQRTPHERVATKPPLIGWISAGLFEITRSWDVAWRLPSFLAAVAISILLFRAATSTYGSTAGVVALSAFGLNLLTPRLATLVRTDMPLALVIFLVGFLIWQKIRKREKWNSRDRLSIFVLLTAGMLIKGPIVYAFLLPGVAMFQWWGRRRDAGSHSAWCGWWPWIASLAVFLVWVAGGILFVPGFFDQVVMREFIGRFGETVHQPKPIYFYLPHLLHKFAPWSILMMIIAVLGFRAEPRGILSFFRKISPETLWLLCWIFGGLLVMSFIPSKRVDRIFPVIPPLCLLLAAEIGGTSPHEQLRERVYRWSAVALLVAMLFTGGYSLLKMASAYRSHRDALANFGHAVRQEAAMHHWRYEAVSASDEGMLLYLEKTHFVGPNRAVTEWNRGSLDALVVAAEDAPGLMRDLRDAALSGLRSSERKDEPGWGYVLLTRSR